VEVGEVAASATGDQNFLAQPVGVLEHRDAASTLAGFDGAHQAGCATAENHCIEGVGHFQSWIVINSSFPQALKPTFIADLYAALKRRSSTSLRASVKIRGHM
jgi:predicted HD phosphohydrolase